MATKYILDPSGNIEKVDLEEGLVTQTFKVKDVENEIKTDYLENVNQNISNKEDINSGESFDSFLTNIQLGLLDGENETETFKKFITTKIDNDPSFGFRNPNDASDNNFKQADENLDRSFKPFNSFTDTDRVFADEFEILTGFRLREGELAESVSTGLLMFTYLAEVIAKIATVEAFVVINQKLENKGRKNTFRQPDAVLRLGKYDFTEYDIFTKYIFNILNYPHETSNSFERIMAYFIGFTEWLAPDSLIDLNEITKKNSSNENFLQYFKKRENLERYDNDDLFGFSLENVENAVFATLDTALVGFISTLQNVVSTALNHTSLNRVRLLLRKFYQERLFKDEVLYSAKQKNNYYFGFFDDLNYYYFKFLIERMQIGLPFLKKYFYGESYYKFNNESPRRRVSAQRFADSYTISNVDNYGKNGTWKSLPKGKTSTRITGIPQLLHSNLSFINTLLIKGKKDPHEKIFSTTIDQNFIKSDNRKIPIETVNQLELELESEYMPFYMHDLRTNEVLSFHAFIESISDSYTPDYNPTSGFGRIDDVRTYTKTTRNINLTFILAATSKMDHDMMWYQINKIVSMCYPQWSNGYLANTSEQKTVNEDINFDLKFPFRYPFTQVPTASPLIRLRVGDVIKSNYSRTSLARLHGLGEEIPEQSLSSNQKSEILSKTQNNKKPLEAQKKELITKSNKLYRKLKSEYSAENISQYTGDQSEEFDKIRKKREALRQRLENLNERSSALLENFNYILGNLSDDKQNLEGKFQEIKNTNTFAYVAMYKYYENENLANQKEKINFKDKEIQKLYEDYAKLDRKLENEKDKIEKEKKALDEASTALQLKVEKNKYLEKRIKDQEELTKIQTQINNLSTQINNYDNNLTSKVNEELSDLNKYVKDKIYKKIIDPITISYESGMSKGLAGFITNLDINYNDSTWEISQGSRAPMLVKINISFSPIHDIPPGLDHNGMMRAPSYNIGKINNAFFGDPNDKD